MFIIVHTIQASIRLRPASTQTQDTQLSRDTDLNLGGLMASSIVNTSAVLEYKNSFKDLIGVIFS